MLRLVIIFTVVLQTNFVVCDLFSSTEELKHLVDEHSVLIDDINGLIDSLESFIDYLKWKVTKYERDQEKMNTDVETYISNPLNAFLLIKRISLDASSILQYLLDFTKYFSSTLNPLAPDELKESVVAIDRLQTTYNLKTQDLSNGIIDSDSFNMSLTAHDLYTIGNELFASEKYSRATEYYISALKKNQILAEFTEISDETILVALVDSHQMTGNYEKAIVAIDDILKLGSTIFDDDKLESLKEELRNLLETGNVEKFVEPEETFNEKMTRKVCNGEIRKSDEEISQLHCRYESKTKFSKIAPFKVEEMNLDPLILMFHEVVSDFEIEILKEIARPKLTQSEIFTEGDLKVSKHRVSKVAWFEDENYEIVRKISKRVEDMTGLSCETAEDLQIQQYGIGGFYNLHHDYIRMMKMTDEGDRMATVLFYLSDVEKGGGTVFPHLKVRVLPEKGSAAFWFNILDSGDNDQRTKHSGCPVLAGNKWVANKWIHERGQEFKRPCTAYMSTIPM